MKNLFCRLTQATADATVTQHFGIYQNCSPNADSPAGYTVSKNQHRSKMKLVPMLLALLLVQFTTGIYKLNAQAPVVTYPWVSVAAPTDVNLIQNSTVVDANGNIYTAGLRFPTSSSTTATGNFSKITPSGVVTTTWATIGSAAPLPNDLVFDANGNLYSSNGNVDGAGGTSTISKITSSGGITVQWAVLANGARPESIAIDANGNLYTANYGNNTVSKITPAGTVTLAWATLPESSRPTDIIVDMNGNVYVSNSIRVSKITPAGVLTLNWAQLGAFSVPQSLVFDSNGNLYTTNRGNNTVSKITPDGVVTQAWATLQQSNGFFDPGAGPDGIAYDPVSNSIFTANQLSKTVSKISVADSSIIQNWVTGLSGGPVSTVISLGNLYVTDYSGGKIARIGLPPAFEISFNQTQPTCANSTNGGLRAIPSETCATGFQYLWTPGGVTTDTISNLAPGIYSVRVVCGTDTVNKSITLTAATVVPAPFTSNQSVCSGATVADLLASPAPGNTIVWYANATGGTPLASSTPLVNATKYYAAQVTPTNCESNTRAVDSVTIGGLLNPRNDTAFCSSSNVNISFGATPGPFGGGGNGSSYNWTATQNGTGIAASGTNAISFTANNTTTTVKKDTVFLTSNYTIPLSYGIKDSTYYFADTTGSIYLDPNVPPNHIGGTADFPKSYGQGSFLFNVTDTLPIGFNFNYYGRNYSKFFIAKHGEVSFELMGSNFIDPFRMPEHVIYGQSRGWTYDVNSKVAYKVAGTAPNRKLIVSFINLKKPNTAINGQYTETFLSNPVAGIGNFQIVLNEGSNTIESLKQSVPEVKKVSAYTLSGFVVDTQAVRPNREAVTSSIGFTSVPGRNFGDWIKIENENKIFFPIPATTCPTQRDTFSISVLPTPKVDSIANMQVCPGSTAPAINFATPITGGTVGYKWSNSNTTIGLAASGFGNIPSFTAAATAQTSTISVRPYMLKSATDTCFGTVRTFVINADLLPAPTTVSSIVAYTGTKTISQLAVTPLAGGSLNYFYQATGGTALAGSTIVVDDTTYYVTQTVAGCESNPRKPIKVNRIAADSIVLCSPATVAGLTATPQAGNTAIWYDVASGGTALANTTALALGQDTLYVEEGNSSAQLSLHSYSTNNPSSTINAFTIGQNDTTYYGVFQDSAKVFRINPDGTGATIISSGGPNESIRFMQYESDASGRYILYSTENTVKRRNLNTGVVTTIWTSPTSPAFNLRQVSRDEANNKLYVADTEFGRIKLVDLANNTAVTIDSLPYKQFGASSFPRRPFAVCYVAPNSLYIGDLTNSLVFKKNLTTGVKTDSISFNSPKEISLLPNGKLMIVGGDKIITTNQDLTGSTNLVTSISSANSAKYNSIGELVYTDYRTIKKISSIQSNRVPVTVIVNPKPIVTATIDKVVCNNSTVAAVNFSTTTGGTVTYAWTNNKTSTGLAASGTGNIASFTAVNNSTGLDTAMVIVTPTITNAGVSCAGTKDTFLIIVNPTANVNTINNQVVCNGSAVTAINFGTTNTGGTVTYAWTNNTTSIGLAASGTGNIATFNSVNNGTAPVTATIVVTPTFTNGGVSCAGPTKTFTITVNPTVTVNPENDQVVCNGAASTAINFSTSATGGTTTYAWTNNKPTNGLAASGTGNIASFTAVNNGTAPDTATIIITPTFTNGGTNCVGTKDTIYVVVNPTAKINAIADKVECNGSVVVATMPTSTATGGTVTYTWTNNTTSIGLAASGTGNIPSFTATNTGSTAITSTIIVTPTYTNGGVSCVGTNDTFNITINPPPIFAATTDKYVCNASTTTAVVFSTALTGGTAVYHWTNNNTAIGLAASGTGNVPSFTATNTTTAPIMGSIVVYMDYTNAGLTCTSLKDTFNYVVNPTAVVNSINDQVLCNGSTTAAISFSTTATGGTLTYNWTNNNTSFGLAASGTGNIASFNAINNTNAPQIATINVTPVFSNGGVSCTVTATSFTITVNPEMIVNAISSQVLCNNASTTAVNFASPTTGGTIVYNWTNSNTAIGLGANGTGNIASFTATNSSNAPMSGTITVIATYTNAGISCTSAPQTFVYSVNPTATVNAISNQTVCNGAAVSAVNFATTATGGTVTYAWTNSNSSIGLAASGTGNIASFTSTNSSNAAVTATITVTPTFTKGGVSCTGTAQSYTVTVNPTAVVNAVSNQVVCNGSSVTTINFGTTYTGGTVTYAWTNNTTSIGLAASGTGNIATFNGVNNGTAPVTATITVTPTFTNGGVSCTGTSQTFTITVNPTANINALNDHVLCNGANFTEVVPTTTATGGTVTYAWTNNNISIGLAASGTGNIPAFSSVNSGTAPVTATVIVTSTFANGGVNCTGTADTFYITVNPTAKIDTITNKVACNGATVAAVTPTSTATGGTVTYAWTNDNASIGLAASGTGTIPAFTTINTGTAPVTATITVKPTFNNGGLSCTGTVRTYTITVNPTATVNTVSNQVVCNGSAATAVNFGTSATGGTVTYSWINSNTTVGLSASGSGNIASFTATNSGTAPVTASITVIPTFTNEGVSCQGTAQTFTITVNPTATVNAISIQTVCNGAAVSAVNFASATTGGTVTYAWTNNNSSIGLAASGTGNIASFNAINNSNAPVTATITVTPTFINGGVSCTGTAQSFALTVNPTAVVNAVSNQTVCAGSSNSAVTFSSPVAGTTYSWTNSNTSIGLAASGIGNVPSFVAVNPSPNAINATITVTPNTAAGCIGQSITYTITVNGWSVAPASINNPTPIVCANNAFTTLSVNGGALGSGAVWKWYADSLNSVSIGSGATLSNIPVAKTTTYFVRAEGTCNNTAAASVVVQRANLVSHIRQHWSDVLLFDNSSKNYVAWQWYKNGVAVNGATLQQYSESSALAGTYYVVATDKNGAQSVSCPLTITAGSFTGLKISLFPNPADKGANVNITTSFTASELVGANIVISDIYGRVIRQITTVSPNIAIQAPTTSGMYIVTLTLQNGMKYSTNLLTK